MNTQRLPALLMFAGLVALVVWWRWPAPVAVAVVPAQPPPALASTGSIEEPVLPPPMAVEPPPAPVVAVEEPPPAPPPAYDPQGELSSSIRDVINLALTGDFATLFQNYIPPDEQAGMSAEEKAATIQQMQAEAQSPQGQQEMQFMLTAVPTYDATGNRATYALPPGNARGAFVFVRVNGRWYLQ